MAEKQMWKIVLTGGPCGGKTKGLSKIVETLSGLGYKVIIIAETATEIMERGFKIGSDGLSVIDFQKMIFKTQLSKEKTSEEGVNFLKSEKVITICDRGILDNKAYIPQEDFTELLMSFGLNEVQSRDEYDAVFHLVTAAQGAEEYYTTENNVYRSETPEGARELDSKIISSWTGHPHFRVVDNSTDFEEKIKRVLTEILTFLGEPVPLEIEEKYLITMPDFDNLFKEVSCEKMDICQTYLIGDDPKSERRVRQRGSDGYYVYFYTCKKNITGRERIQDEKMIKASEYLTLLMSADTSLHQIIKKRYCFVWNGTYYELDVYPFWDKHAILEIEMAHKDQIVEIPPFINVIADVTENPSFKNYSIAREIPDLNLVL